MISSDGIPPARRFRNHSQRKRTSGLFIRIRAGFIDIAERSAPAHRREFPAQIEKIAAVILFFSLAKKSQRILDLSIVNLAPDLIPDLCAFLLTRDLRLKAAEPAQLPRCPANIRSNIPHKYIIKCIV